MSMNFTRKIGAALLLGVCGTSFAEPIALTDSQLDAVSAGTTINVPHISYFSSIGATSWAFSSTTVAPGFSTISDATFNATVGLYRNNATFTYVVRYY